MAFFTEIEKRGLEGIVSKRKNSFYRQGKRSDEWLKLPTENRQEFVIGGWVESEAGQPFKTLIFGAYKSSDLIYIGHSGSGFTTKEQKDILAKLNSIRSSKNPFKKNRI